MPSRVVIQHVMQRVWWHMKRNTKTGLTVSGTRKKDDGDAGNDNKRLEARRWRTRACREDKRRQASEQKSQQWELQEGAEGWRERKTITYVEWRRAMTSKMANVTFRTNKSSLSWHSLVMFYDTFTIYNLERQLASQGCTVLHNKGMKRVCDCSTLTLHRRSFHRPFQKRGRVCVSCGEPALTGAVDGHGEGQGVADASVKAVGAHRHHLDHVAAVGHQLIEDGALVASKI